VNVTGDGCLFANFSVYGGFSTGSASFITWLDSGERNAYVNVHFQGLADSASAGGANARTLKINGIRDLDEAGRVAIIDCTEVT
jgi:hypothetical protein